MRLDPGARAQRGPGLGRTLALAAAIAGLALSQAHAQGAPFAGDGARPAASPAAARGEGPFRTTCGFCHGAQAHGAQGPDLTRSPIALSDAALGVFLKVGRPAVGMPAFPNFSAAEVADLSAYIKSQASAAPNAAQVDPAGILVGDAKAGAAYFNGPGHCATCHSPTGDLKGVGARYNPMVLQGRIINPRVGRGAGPARPPAPTLVTVTEPNGRVTRGTLVQVNDFYVTLVDTAGVRRTFNRDNQVPKVEVNDPAEAHRQMMMTWKDQDMWNVTAYLAGLK